MMTTARSRRSAARRPDLAAGFLAAGLVTACTGTSPVTSPGADPDHAAIVEAWRGERLADLKRADGWLTLVGLVWLDEDRAYAVGSEQADPVRLPRGPEDVGTLKKVGGNVILDVAHTGVTVDGRPAAGSVDLRTDAHEKGASEVAVGGVTFHLIDRAGRLGVRIKDPKAPARAAFQGVPHYPTDSGWRVTATLDRDEIPQMVSVPTVIGTVLEEPSPGVLRFEHAGQSLALHPIGSRSGLFLVFGDATNGAPDGSYGGGRFLSVPWDGSSDTVELDFNKAYNPPCAFTAFATCPLPPAVNKLGVAIEAGEKAMPGGVPGH